MTLEMSAAFWSLLGVAVAVVIYWLQRIRRYPSRLSFTISFFSPVLQRIPMNLGEITLKYQDLSINRDLYYVDFMVFNTRNSDVGLPNTDSSLSIILPNNTKWVDILVRKESDGIGSSVAINKDNLSEAVLSFHMLRVNECIRMEGLIEASSIGGLDISEPFLSFKHRIHDLDKLKYVPYISEIKSRRSKKTLRRSIIWLALLLGCLCGLLFLPHYSKIFYEDNVTKEIVAASINSEDFVVVDKSNTLTFTHNCVISPNEFIENYTPVFHYYRPHSNSFNLTILILAIIMYCFLVFDECIDLYRYKVVKRIMVK